jgi:uncharacterized membrane protein YfhO
MYLSFPLDKGWNLKLDGVDAKLMYVNNGMTGVYLSKGDHKVEMDYKLRLFNKGVMLIPIGILLMLGLFIMGKKNVNLIKYTATEN